MRSNPFARLVRTFAFVPCVVLAGCGGGTAVTRDEGEKTAAQAESDRIAASTPRTVDEAVERTLVAIQTGDFAAVHAALDEAAQKALPAATFEAAWKEQTADLGALVSWKVENRTVVEKHAVVVMRLTHEKGELAGLFSVHPDSLRLAGLFFKPVAKPAVPAPYVDPGAFREEHPKLGAEPFVLSATLTLPTKAPARVPGVVLVHGSGPSDQDETIGGIAPFKDLAEGLSSQNIAVLRYNKRTFEHGEKLTKTLGIDEEVILDAVAAVKLLKTRPEVDPKRIYVVGHSLGALLAPEIAVRATGVAGVVLLAPPGRPPIDTVLAQLRYLEAPAATVAAVEKSAAEFKAAPTGEGTILGMPFAYWTDWTKRDGVAMAKKLRKPVLILHGDRDYQVTDEDIATWRKGLARMPNVKIETIPGGNHCFIPGTGKSLPAEYSEPGHVDEAVIKQITAFVR